jgi:hypothetical protein
VWLHELGHARRRRREALPRARRAVLGRRGLHPQRPLPRHRDRLVDHVEEWLVDAATCAPSRAWCGRARRASSTTPRTP